MPLIFVYGTLKRGGSNHQQLAGQSFVDRGRTVPGFRLYSLGPYPGMIVQPSDHEGVEGEVWWVDDGRLKALDEFEGVPQGIYRREIVALLPPFAGQVVEAYVYPHGVAGRAEIGSVWTE